MSQTRAIARPAQVLEVGVRRTLSGDGTVLRSATVQCPRSERAGAVSTCFLCADYEGLHRTDRGNVMICTAPAAPVGAFPSRANLVPLSDVMTRDVVCVRDDVSAESVAALFIDLGISGAPVVDERGRPIGVVSKSDLVQLDLGQAGIETGTDESATPGPGFRVEPPSRGRVGEFMMPVSLTLPESASVARAAALMAYERIHRLPVVAPDGSVVGVVSALDILRWLAEREGYALTPRRDRPRHDEGRGDSNGDP